MKKSEPQPNIRCGTRQLLHASACRTRGDLARKEEEDKGDRLQKHVQDPLTLTMSTTLIEPANMMDRQTRAERQFIADHLTWSGAATPYLLLKTSRPGDPYTDMMTAIIRLATLLSPVQV